MFSAEWWSLNLMVWGVLLLLIFGIMWIINWLEGNDLFEWDDRNPYRRHCKKCGQRQEKYCFDFAEGRNGDWWEDVGSIKDESCECHCHSTYRSLI